MTTEQSEPTKQRKHKTLAEKYAIVQEALTPGIMKTFVAAKHDISPQVLHGWIRSFTPNSASVKSAIVSPKHYRKVRRSFTKSQKREIVKEVLQAGESLILVARKYALRPDHLRLWIKRFGKSKKMNPQQSMEVLLNPVAQNKASVDDPQGNAAFGIGDLVFYAKSDPSLHSELSIRLGKIRSKAFICHGEVAYEVIAVNAPARCHEAPTPYNGGQVEIGSNVGTFVDEGWLHTLEESRLIKELFAKTGIYPNRNSNIS